MKDFRPFYFGILFEQMLIFVSLYEWLAGAGLDPKKQIEKKEYDEKNIALHNGRHYGRTYVSILF